METDQGELLKTIASFLDSHHIPYMLTGALSVVYYGRPRASHDIDFVVELPEKDYASVVDIMKQLPGDYMVQPEAIARAVREKDMFTILHLPTMLKLDFWLLQDDEFDQTRFKRRQRVTLLNRKMTITSAEDTILQKLRWYKEARIEKHVVDAAFVYQVQKKELDMSYLTSWAKKLAVAKFLKQLGTINLAQYL